MSRLMPLLLMRRTVMLVAAAIALVLVVSIAWVPKPADASHTRVVTRTFSNNEPIIIPAGAPTATSGAAAPYPSALNVGGFDRGTILDVNLLLRNYSHTHPDDVDVLLGHRQRMRTVMSDVGLSADVNNITLNLDDEAPNGFLPDDGPLVGGRFRPTNVDPDFFPQPTPTPSSQSELSGYDGMNPNGPWMLRVVDDSSVDVGRFAGGWSLTIRARVQPFHQ